MVTSSTRPQTSWPIVLAVWVACGVYTVPFISRGWVPHDEGTIGQSAVRVLHREVPHRDFDDMYTGGLTYLNAAGMAVFGENLRAPRFVLFGAFMAFLAAVHAIARRLSSGGVALGAMVLSAVWTTPNYFVSLPSWYNLFFATFGTLVFLRYLDTNRRRWLFVAGLAGGCSVLMKISGVFYLAGGALALAAIEREATRTNGRSMRTRLLVAGLAGVFVVTQLVLVREGRLTTGLLQILLPLTLVVLCYAWWEWRIGGGAPGERLAALATRLWPFAAGAGVPIVLFLGWYAAQGALAELLRGVFLLPQRRLTEAAADPPGAATLILGVPCVALVLAGRSGRVRFLLPASLALAAALGWVLAHGDDPLVYSAIWSLVRSLPLAAVVAGVWVLGAERWSDRPGGPTRAHVHLLMSLAATVSLIQVPYATGIYFCYGVPFAFLALLAVSGTRPWSPRPLHAVSAAFLIGFAVLYMNTAYVWALGRRYVPYAATADLGARGSIQVRPGEAALYRDLMAAIQARVPPGRAIWAGPDAPEVYFLGGYVNPTRAFFDFLTPEPLTAPRMEALLDQSGLQAAVVNTRPLFSPPLDPDVLEVLRRRFPDVRRVGPFEVFASATPGVHSWAAVTPHAGHGETTAPRPWRRRADYTIDGSDLAKEPR